MTLFAPSPSRRYNNPLLRHLVVVVACLMTLSTTAQVVEDFSDGEYLSNPTWLGDTAKFKVNANHQLQLYTEGSDSAWLAFRYAVPVADTITWELWMKESFSPTIANHAWVGLYADAPRSADASHCLALAVADPLANDKRVTLFHNDSAIVRFPHQLKASTNAMRFKVSLIAGTFLHCWVDTVGETASTDWVDMGLFMLDYMPLADSAWMGVECHYTSSRSHHFYFDDFRVGTPADSTVTPGVPSSRHHAFGDVLVNEILFNPPPDGADYVELYNNTDSAIALADLRLARWVGDSVNRYYTLADSGVVAPHDFVVVTTDAAFVSSHYDVRHPFKLVQVSAMPSYNDASGVVLVAGADSTVLDRFDYTEKMHSRLLRDVEGVALERRSYSAATQDEANWYSAASTAGYGTPTYRNSQSRELLYVDNDFLVEPLLFSPDGDGYEDLLNLSWQLQDCDLSANITLYDAHGRPVRHLARGVTLGCDGMLTWDGLTDAGTRCRQGNYIVVIEAYNVSGRRQQSRRVVSLVVK